MAFDFSKITPASWAAESAIQKLVINDRNLNPAEDSTIRHLLLTNSFLNNMSNETRNKAADENENAIDVLKEALIEQAINAVRFGWEV